MKPQRTTHHGRPTLPSKVLNGGFATFVIQLCKHNMEDGTKKLPPKFLHYFADSIPNPIVLQIPNGRRWSIELNCYEGNAWLDSGWRKFLTDLSLVPTTSLFFQLNTDSSIFDVTAYQFRCCDEVEFQAPETDDDTGFRITVKDYMIQADSLLVPRSNLQPYLGLENEHYIILILEGRGKSVTLTTNPEKSSYFITNGWSSFAVEHNIKDDQECEIKIYVSDDGKLMLSMELIN